MNSDEECPANKQGEPDSDAAFGEPRGGGRVQSFTHRTSALGKPQSAPIETQSNDIISQKVKGISQEHTHPLRKNNKQHTHKYTLSCQIS